MPNEYAALWSAVAATFAATSAFLTWRVQRRNLLESMRPELVLTGWDRRSRGQGDAQHEVVAFQKIKNVGRGAALHVVLNCHHELDNRPTAGMSTTRFAIVAPGEELQVEGDIIVWWKNVPERDGAKYLPMSITGMCWDAGGMRHETKYSLMATPLGPAAWTGGDALAPGLIFTTRRTTTRSVRLLKLDRWRQNQVARLQRWPLLGRLLKTRPTTI